MSSTSDGSQTSKLILLEDLPGYVVNVLFGATIKFSFVFVINVTGVNKKLKKFKTLWHGVRGILKLSGRVHQASLKLSVGFSNTVC